MSQTAKSIQEYLVIAQRRKLTLEEYALASGLLAELSTENRRLREENDYLKQAIDDAVHLRPMKRIATLEAKIAEGHTIHCRCHTVGESAMPWLADEPGVAYHDPACVAWRAEG